MTAQEAIKHLKEITGWANFWGGCYKDKLLAIETAIEALEKQIPKKILYVKQNYGTPWLCCECESDQTPTEFFSTDGSEPKEKHTYCWKCGQKLDWGEQNEQLRIY